MQYSKAEEILKSPRTIEVLYKGEPVWINNLNPNEETAEITLGRRASKIINVHVSELIENT